MRDKDLRVGATARSRAGGRCRGGVAGVMRCVLMVAVGEVSLASLCWVNCLVSHTASTPSSCQSPPEAASSSDLSVIRSWPLDLTAAALLEDPGLADFTGHVSDSGEGRWALQAANDEGAPAPRRGSSWKSRSDAT